MKILITGDISTNNIKEFIVRNIEPRFRGFIEGADLVVYNLGGPISRSEKFARDSKLQFRENGLVNLFYLLLYSLNIYIRKKPHVKVFSGIEIFKLLKMNPNTLVTLANNHIKDLGKKGLEETLDILKENNINYIGAGKNLDKCKDFEFHDIIFINVNWVGVKKFSIPFHLYSATRKTFGANYLSSRELFEKIEEFKKLDKRVVLIIHGGSVLPEKIKDLSLDLEMIRNLNADITVIHHPHLYVKTKYEKDNIFVLGDFIFQPKDVSLDLFRESAILKIYIKEGLLIPEIERFKMKDVFNYE